MKDYGHIRVLGLITCLSFLAGCAAVGPPIPPEDVGIAAKVRKQRKDKQQSKQAAIDEQEATSDPEEEVELPTFYPIGVR